MPSFAYNFSGVVVENLALPALFNEKHCGKEPGGVSGPNSFISEVKRVYIRC